MSWANSSREYLTVVMIFHLSRVANRAGSPTGPRSSIRSAKSESIISGAIKGVKQGCSMYRVIQL